MSQVFHSLMQVSLAEVEWALEPVSCTGHNIIHSFNLYLWNSYYVTETALNSGDKGVNKINNFLASRNNILLGETNIIQENMQESNDRIWDNEELRCKWE